jgi:hypothetical protein
VPVSWEVDDDGVVADPSLDMHLLLRRRSGPVGPGDVEEEISRRRERQRIDASHDQELASVRQVMDTRAALPDPWRSQELEVTIDAGIAGKQTLRFAVFGREASGELWEGEMWYPASLGEDLAPTLGEVLRSAQPIVPARREAR